MRVLLSGANIKVTSHYFPYLGIQMFLLKIYKPVLFRYVFEELFLHLPKTTLELATMSLWNLFSLLCALILLSQCSANPIETEKRGFSRPN